MIFTSSGMIMPASLATACADCPTACLFAAPSVNMAFRSKSRSLASLITQAPCLSNSFMIASNLASGQMTDCSAEQMMP
jgi:hypothetical protein